MGISLGWTCSVKHLWFRQKTLVVHERIWRIWFTLNLCIKIGIVFMQQLASNLAETYVGCCISVSAIGTSIWGYQECWSCCIWDIGCIAISLLPFFLASESVDHSVVIELGYQACLPELMQQRVCFQQWKI